MKAQINFICKNWKIAKAISDAISPDNEKAPKGLLIKTYVSKNNLEIMVDYNRENYFTFQSTIDDLLSCISVTEKSFLCLK